MFSMLSAGDSPLLLGEKWCQLETCLSVSLPARIRPWGRPVGPPPRQAGGARPAPALRPVPDLVPSLSSSTVPAATYLATHHSPYVVGPFSIHVSLEPSILKCSG